MISLLSDFESHFQEYLTPNQFQTLSILISLINQYRQVKIEKLAGYFPLPIQFESRRKHLQRFLVLTALSVPLIWFPIISAIIAQKIPSGKSLVVAIDRTQWQDKNIFLITLIYNHHGLPLYWKPLDKKGGYNIEESKANEQRLTSLLLLIAIGYTNQTLKGKIIKIKGMQKYIGRVTEKKRKIKRNSDFWVGIYGEIWINNYDNYQEEVEKIMARNKNKQKFYQQGIKVKEKLEKLYSESIS